MIIVAIGIVLTALGVWLWRRAVRNRAARVAWLATRGSITSSGVTVEKSSAENGGTTTRFAAYYAYAIDGTPQRGYIYTDRTKHHKTLLAKYSAGTPVDVFYDPAKPSRSEIRDPLVYAGGWSAGLDQLSYVLMPGGAIAVVVGLIFAFIGP